jgi:hypothetical protein
LARDGLSAFDPTATIPVISPPVIDALRDWWLGGASIFGGVHQLENAAFSQRKPNSDIWFDKISASTVLAARGAGSHHSPCVCLAVKSENMNIQIKLDVVRKSRLQSER